MALTVDSLNIDVADIRPCIEGGVNVFRKIAGKELKPFHVIFGTIVESKVISEATEQCNAYGTYTHKFRNNKYIILGIRCTEIQNKDGKGNGRLKAELTNGGIGKNHFTLEITPMKRKLKNGEEQGKPWKCQIEVCGELITENREKPQRKKCPTIRSAEDLRVKDFRELSTTVSCLAQPGGSINKVMVIEKFTSKHRYMSIVMEQHEAPMMQGCQKPEMEECDGCDMGQSEEPLMGQFKFTTMNKMTMKNLTITDGPQCQKLTIGRRIAELLFFLVYQMACPVENPRLLIS